MHTGKKDDRISTSSFFLSLGSKSRVFMSSSWSLLFSSFLLDFSKRSVFFVVGCFVFVVCLFISIYARRLLADLRDIRLHQAASWSRG